MTHLNIRQLPSHLDLEMLLNTAQGSITGLTITYGLKARFGSFFGAP